MNQDDQLSMPPTENPYDHEPDTVNSDSVNQPSSRKLDTWVIVLHAMLLLSLPAAASSFYLLIALYGYLNILLSDIVDQSAIINLTYISCWLLFLTYFAAIFTVDYLFLKRRKPSSAVRIVVLISMAGAAFMCLMLTGMILFSRASDTFL